MTELAQKSALRTSALKDYVEPAAQYAAVRDGGVGLIDLSSRGRFLVSGSEAVMFLNGLITNDIKALAKNSWMPAAFPNVQGRLLALVRIIHRGDGFLIDTESATHDTLLKLLDRFTLAGDFRVADLTEQTIMLSVQGKTAEEMVRATIGDPEAKVEHRQMVNAKLANGVEITVIRATHTAEDGFDLFVDATAAEFLWNRLVAAGARPIGSETLEVLRIEAGIPRYGIDMDETNVVTEANLDDAVSFTKGCYVGQEIIARIKYRGHVAKKLTGVILEQETRLETGARILSQDEKDIGRITSSVFSPRLKRTVALGYVKYDYLALGTEVKVTTISQNPPEANDLANRCAAAQVAELPFVRGSWYSRADG